jgi:phosphatidylglycerophosphate synthase
MSGDPTPDNPEAARRPLKSRQTRWAVASASWLARHNVSPNAISILSIVFAAAAGGAYAGCRVTASPLVTSGLLVLASAGIQGRLLCNLLDGMVAIEGGKKSRSGEIFNDAPDRVADAIILAAAGYAITLTTLGWVAAAGALLTAYVRVLGRSLGAGVYFVGPMAKQHRMATMTAANLVAALALPWGWSRGPQVAALALAGALVLIVVGSVVTAARRLVRIVGDLEARP